MKQFRFMFLAKKQCITFEMLVVTNNNVTCFQFFDKPRICIFFDHLNSIAYQTHNICTSPNSNFSAVTL